ncbi:transposase [Pseudomonas sp. Z18(2022)]|uniref:transposase n=1 Tax=Pseudomonas sp. Z18(2022) TaxID=2983410 RepID=UPI003FA69F4E
MLRGTEAARCQGPATHVAQAHDLAGRHLYAVRKQTLEPVFSIIKSVMGFRQSLLRVKEEVGGEWSLVCLDWNLNRMAAMRQKSVQDG